MTNDIIRLLMGLSLAASVGGAQDVGSTPQADATPGPAHKTAVTRIGSVALTLEASSDPVKPGWSLTYTVWLSNPSAHPLTGVTLTERYPPLFTFVSANPAPTTGDSVWNVGMLEAGGVKAIVINGKVFGTAEAGNRLTNSVTVAAANAATDRAEGITLVTGKSCPGKTAIRVTTRDDADPVKPGGALAYTIRVENPGPLVVTNVVLTETADPLFTRVSAAPSPDGGSGTVWSVGRLEPHAFVEIVVSGFVSTSAPNGYLVVGTVVAQASNTDPSSDDEVTRVGLAPQPELKGTVRVDPAQDGQIVYTVTAANESTAGAVSNVTVVESYSPNFLFLSSIPAPMEGSVKVWRLGDLPPGSRTNIVITGIVSMNARKSAVLFNTTEVFSDSGSRTVHSVTPILGEPPVTVRFFCARTAAGRVNLKWATATECETLEFNLYRSEGVPSARISLNKEPVSGANAKDGQLYQFLDTTARRGVPYCYWLVGVAGDYKTPTYSAVVRPALASLKRQPERSTLGAFSAAIMDGLYRIRYKTLATTRPRMWSAGPNEPTKEAHRQVYASAESQGGPKTNNLRDDVETIPTKQLAVQDKADIEGISGLK